MKRKSSSDPAPVPSNFRIIGTYSGAKHLAMWLRYPNCTNFGGHKILVFTGHWAQCQTEIDPHFFEDSHLIARFVPTARGWEMAVDLIRTLEETWNDRSNLPTG